MLLLTNMDYIQHSNVFRTDLDVKTLADMRPDHIKSSTFSRQ
jgi:hypothetical protein